MRVYLLLSIIFLFSICVRAQNLVPNPSFEDTVFCPTGLSEIYFSDGWTSFTESVDFFSACGNSTTGVPENALGYQLAASGQSYAGLIVCGPLASVNAREFAGIEMLDSLQIGQKYYASLKVVLSDPRGFHNCASNNIGLRFTNQLFNEPEGSALLINNLPQIFTNSIIDDSIVWQTISGSFIADSNYKFVMIGNFFEDALTDTFHCVTGGAYYFIDDICVSLDSNFCYNFNSIEKSLQETISVYPNPFEDILICKSNQLFNKLIIRTILGAVVCNLDFESTNLYSMKLTDEIKNGLYLLELYQLNNEKIIVKKIVVNHK